MSPSQAPPESKIGDIIQAVNEQPISNPKEMFREVRKCAVGDKVSPCPLHPRARS